jgi:acetyl-CoA C-acetyltransferase
MREVAILGVGQTPVREHWDRTVTQLAVEAGRAALEDAGVGRVDAIYVGNMTGGLLSGQRQLGAMVAERIGQRGVEAVRMEAACGSAGSAMRQGLIGVASGEMDAVLVIGVEKLTESKGVETTAALATAADADFEVSHGVSFVALNALIMRRYMHVYGYAHNDFAPFPVNAHANAAHNPNAMFQEPISRRTYERGRMVADPISLFDASPIGDGAAALLLVPVEKAPEAVRVVGSASSVDTVAVHDREDPLWLKAAEQSSSRAYAQAGIGPDDVDLFELHDAFSIMAALSLEACGFAEQGQGVRLGLEGDILPGGRIPICTLGGLKARGHPVGATGLYQLVEAVLQLRGLAGPAQIDGARTAMTQNIGGSGATVVTHILRSMS